MTLDRNPWMACAGRAALALALVLTAGCGDDGGGTDGDDSTGSTSAPTTSTSSTPTTTEPTGTTGTTGATTGDESSESGSGETGAVAVDYMADIQPIWDMRCVAGCHVDGGAAGANGPILTEDKSYAELVNVESKTVAGFVQVKPGDPEASYVWHKINGTQANVGGLGSTMPLGGMLSAEDLATIEAWITAGAKP
jgi:hypothetical protein